MSDVIPVILAGGQGTRLWPASLPSLPKQFLSVGSRNLIEQAVDRALHLGDTVLILTSQHYLGHFQTHLRVTKEQKKKLLLIGEPAPRNTAPALALALNYLRETHGDAILLLITADHLISPTDQFVEDARKAVAQARRGDIVTFGIVPNKAETGYGYIECGEALAESVYRVRSFREKPSKEKAEEYLAKGNFFWNSGMFCFSVQAMMEEFALHSSELYQQLLAAAIPWKEETRQALRSLVPQSAIFSEVEKISLDYAIMEHTKKAAVVPAQFHWNDVGSWDELAQWMDAHPADAESAAPLYLCDAENITARTDRPLAVSGVSDLVVVSENGRILIMKKGRGQDVSLFSQYDATLQKPTTKKEQ